MQITEEKFYMPLYRDVPFKALFGNTRYMSLLCYLLSACLDIPVEDLKGKVKFVNTELSKYSIYDQTKRVDLLIELESEIISIEMNPQKNSNFIDRNVAYIASILARDFQNQIRKKEKKNRYIQINFNLFSLNNERKVKDVYYLQNKNGEHLTEILEIIHIDIDYCKQIWYDNSKQEVKKKLPELIYWGSILASESKEEVEEIMKEEMVDVKDNLLQAIDTIHTDSLVINEFNRDDIYWYDMVGFIEEGEKRGLERGENQSKLKIAKNLLSAKIDPVIIKKATGLSDKDLKRL